MSQPPQTNADTDRRFATTLARGLSVLRAFRASDNGLGNAEISQRTGLPKSTVSRLTFTLKELGYLTDGRRHDRYRPGPALLVLGNMANGSLSFMELADPMMQRLADRTKTLAILLVRDRQKLLIVRTWRPRSAASIWLEVGHRVPLNGSSSGAALLGRLASGGLDEVTREVAGDHDLTVTRAAEIHQNGAGALARQGFVIADPATYFAPDIHAVAVPFSARDLPEPVVFTCGALPEMLSMERMQQEVGPELRDRVAELERMVGQRTHQPAIGDT